jgi:multidrug efflux pump subunit AcrB
MISLDNLINIPGSHYPIEYLHFNRFKSVTISANLQPVKLLAMELWKCVVLPKKCSMILLVTSLSGSSREYAESSSNTLFALVLAIGLIILVLAAQFESFIDPLIIINHSSAGICRCRTIALDIWTNAEYLFQDRMIMLVGLVTKNGILIVEFANQNRRKKGMKKTEAVIYAATMRLRLS